MNKATRAIEFAREVEHVIDISEIIDEYFEGMIIDDIDDLRMQVSYFKELVSFSVTSVVMRKSIRKQAEIYKERTETLS